VRLAEAEKRVSGFSAAVHALEQSLARLRLQHTLPSRSWSSVSSIHSPLPSSPGPAAGAGVGTSTAALAREVAELERESARQAAVLLKYTSQLSVWERRLAAISAQQAEALTLDSELLRPPQPQPQPPSSAAAADAAADAGDAVGDANLDSMAS
jgi:hypothetical protein